MLTERDLNRIAQRIVRRYAPLLVGVFGSYATNTAHGKSDLDLFILKDLEGKTMSRAERRHAVKRLLVGVLHPLDVHVYTPNEFEAEATRPLSLAATIQSYGRVLYASSSAERLAARFEARPHK